MYQIAIDTQTMVSISTAGRSLSGNATFDSQLFSLKRKGGNRNHVRAVALHGNNDAAVGNHGSRIGDELDSSTTGGGQGAVGEYHIKLHAVNGFVPSPGAIALLGIAGLVKRRRR
jgi:hypothetical protein